MFVWQIVYDSLVLVLFSQSTPIRARKELACATTNPVPPSISILLLPSDFSRISSFSDSYDGSCLTGTNYSGWYETSETVYEKCIPCAKSMNGILIPPTKSKFFCSSTEMKRVAVCFPYLSRLTLYSKLVPNYISAQELIFLSSCKWFFEFRLQNHPLTALAKSSFCFNWRITIIPLTNKNTDWCYLSCASGRMP